MRFIVYVLSALLVLTVGVWAVARGSVRVSGFTFYPSGDNQALYGVFKLTNVSSQPVSGLRVELHMRDGYGRLLPVAAVTPVADAPSDALAPGQTRRYRWAWYNTTGVGVFTPPMVVVSGLQGAVAFNVDLFPEAPGVSMGVPAPVLPAR